MITKELFGTMPSGEAVDAYTITNASGASMTVLTLGGILQKLMMPDRNGNFADVVCGFDTPEDYLADTCYYGATIGRYGNRIANGHFVLDGKDYQLNQNSDHGISLHGGNEGFSRKLWAAVPFEKKTESGLILSYVSPDGEENYPGELSVTVTYTLTDKNEVKIAYRAETDAPTVLNLTNHSYFNLLADSSREITDHILTVNADAFCEVDEYMIPTGNAVRVEGTPFDFRTPHTIGERIGEEDVQLKFGLGYDHHFFLNPHAKTEKVITLSCPETGRAVDVYTDEPGVQLYTGNCMNGRVCFKGGISQEPRHAVCLETQHTPDSPNHEPSELFPSTVLRPGEIFASETVYAFRTES